MRQLRDPISQAEIFEVLTRLSCSLDHLLTMSVSTDRLPLHTARGAAVVAMSRAIGVRHHGTSRTICSIEWCTSPGCSLNCTPSSLAGEDSVVESIERAWAGSIDEGSMTHKRDMVEAEVPDRGVSHAVGAKGHQSANDCSGKDVVLDIC
jgi:hypothetical protein